MKKLYWIILIVICAVLVYYFGFVKKYSPVSLDVNLGKASGAYIISPNGGENLTIGQNYNLVWHSPYGGFQATVFMVEDNGSKWNIFDAGGVDGANTFTWKVGETGVNQDGSSYYGISEGNYRMEVCQHFDGPRYDNCDASDDFFSISPIRREEPRQWWRWW